MLCSLCASGPAAASGSLWLRWRSVEKVVDDRCALDGSPCVHAGRINSGRYACTESKTRRRGYALEAKRPRRLGAVKTAPFMTGGATNSEKPDT